MIKIKDFIASFSGIFPGNEASDPWEITENLPALIEQKIKTLDKSFIIKKGIAIHKTAVIESGVILKAPVIISEKCFVGAHAYIRGGVYIGKSSSIGPCCEIKSSIILNQTTIAHFNFIGDSIIGSDVNFEAGAITANYFNERKDKTISVVYKSETIKTEAKKFGALVGDNCKIGASAVLSPGTLLVPGVVVKRLELVEQVKQNK